MAFIYEEEFMVHQSECDPWNRMTPGAVLRRAQEISTVQCEGLGVDNVMYQKTHTLFLLSRISLEVNRMPARGERLVLQTRPYNMNRALFQRVTALMDKEGNTLCEADSRWVLVDTGTRRILRKPPEGFVNPFTEPQGPEGHDMKMPPHQEPLPRCSQRAAYTMCDINGHINNTRYADLVCDLLPTEKLKQGPVRKMLLFYHSEIRLGEEFAVLGAAAGQNGFYFVAEEGGKKSFEGYAEL